MNGRIMFRCSLILAGFRPCLYAYTRDRKRKGSRNRLQSGELKKRDYFRHLVMYGKNINLYLTIWAGYRSRSSELLRAGMSGDSVPMRERFSSVSRPALLSTQFPVQWVPVSFAGVKRQAKFKTALRKYLHAHCFYSVVFCV
jgi:hypothetical protein